MSSPIDNQISHYPSNAKKYLNELRTMIHRVAGDLELGKVEESLKWQEPSLTVPSGSPIRMDWKLKTPNHCYLFFHCQTKLVDTFRELYADELQFQGNRAIVLSLDQPLPYSAIEHCLTLALTYQERKHFPLLSAM
ncbi:DUF1801 domain-containing protein [Vibrio mexicanus]|uniref:DUF1801 domain-containing protein n=1 Tax=Vibrio mexicanus TaxID=1004326 RepID=UPI00063CA1B6|nr:DUF1801 domain-containing protein [Vibrio mexicanus]